MRQTASTIQGVYGNEAEIGKGRPSAVTLGFFDGLHIGHTALISRCVDFARMHGLSADVFTFRDNPRNVMTGKLAVPRLLSETEKLKRLKALGVDRIFDFDFADGFHAMPPEAFAKNLIKEAFRAEAVFCGADFRFGANASGDAARLRALGREYGFEVYILDSVNLDGHIVSSTLIRHLVNSGETERASRFLGRKYGLSGVVEKGKEIGRGFGFPTANIFPDPRLTLPARGVYVTETLAKGAVYNSVSNVGVNPTIAEGNAVRVEAHLLDHDVSLYGEKITVLFRKMLRPERRFENIEALKRQVSSDIEAARQFFAATGATSTNAGAQDI